ncbi:MAG: lecithin retinol acyltransferase [Bacteroidota bacterium]|nr:lecithin retinol acyltransferase [Bacteroidota bacterium]
MTNKFKNLLLRPADRIVVPKSNLNWVQHHAIYLGKDSYGVHWFAENKIGKGVQFTTATDFFASVNEITGIERFIGNVQERDEAVRRAYLHKGKPYDLLLFNCEHYSNMVQYKEIRSEQISTGLKVGLGFAALLLFGAIFID